MVAYCLVAFKLVDTYVIFDFFSGFYRRRYEKPRLYLSAAAVYYALTVSVNFLQEPLANLLTGFLFIQVIGYALFCPHGQKFFYNYLFFMYLALIDFVTMLIFSMGSGMALEALLAQTILPRLFVNNTILFATYRLVAKILARADAQLPSGMNMALGVIAMGQMALLLYLYIAPEYLSGPLPVFFLVGFIGLNYCMVYLFDYAAKLSRAAAASRLYSSQAALAYRDLQAADESNRAIRGLSHDLRAHLQVMMALGEAERLEYIGKMNQRLAGLKKRRDFQHPVLNFLLDHMLLRAESAGVEVTVKTEPVSLDFIEDFDMTTIFSNLLNNALEACAEADERRRFIRFYLLCVNCHLVVHLENGFDKNAVACACGALLSSKADHPGIGLENARSAVEKYGGDLQTDFSGEAFVVKIIIPLPA